MCIRDSVGTGVGALLVGLLVTGDKLGAPVATVGLAVTGLPVVGAAEVGDGVGVSVTGD